MLGWLISAPSCTFMTSLGRLAHEGLKYLGREVLITTEKEVTNAKIMQRQKSIRFNWA